MFPYLRDHHSVAKIEAILFKFCSYNECDSDIYEYSSKSKIDTSINSISAYVIVSTFE